MMLACSTGVLAGRTAWRRSGGKQVKKEPSSTLTPSIAGATLRCSARRRTAARHPRHPQRRPWLPVAARPHPCTRASRATERYIYASRRSGGRLAMKGKRLLQWQAVGASSRPANGPVPEGARTNPSRAFCCDSGMSMFASACHCTFGLTWLAPFASHERNCRLTRKSPGAECNGPPVRRGIAAPPTPDRNVPTVPLFPQPFDNWHLHGQAQAKGTSQIEINARRISLFVNFLCCYDCDGLVLYVRRTS